MKKSVLTLAVLVLTVTLLCALLTCGVGAVNGGSFGTNLYWAYNASTGVLSIVGNGAMPDYTSSVTAPWYEHRDSITSLSIDARITAIGAYSFYNCSKLTGVTIPANVASIGASAFAGCSKLFEVQNLSGLTVNAGTSANGGVAQYAKFVTTDTTSHLTRVDGHIFFKDTDASYYLGYIGADTAITVPASFTAYDATTVSSFSVYSYAFSGNTALTSIALPAGVTAIGDYAFRGCTALVSVSFADSSTLASVGQYAFEGCAALASVNFGNGSALKTIGASAFSGDKYLTSFTVPSGVTSIGSAAFSGCTKLLEVKNLSSLILSAGATTYGGITQYAKRIYTEGESFMSVENGHIFIKDTDGAFYCGYLGNDTEISIPAAFTAYDSTTVNSFIIYKNAFLNNTAVTKIHFPASVTAVGEYAFRGCTSLTRVSIEDLAAWSGIEFAKGSDSSNYYTSNPLAIAHNLYINGILAVTLELPETVTEIGAGAFYGCTSATSVNVPTNITNIGADAFGNCTSLNRVNISDLSGWCQIPFVNDTSNPLYYGKNLTLNYVAVTDLVIPDDVMILSNRAFVNCSGLKTLIIPDTLLIMGNNAFYGCSGLESVTFEENGILVGISDYAFYGCTGLTGFDIPAYVTSIGNYAFGSCTGFTEFVIPDTVTSMGVCIFDKSYNITIITIPYLTSRFSYIYTYHISSSNDYSRYMLRTVNITGGTSIPQNAFSACMGITNITIPDSVTSIGNSAFSSCFNLTSISIPDNVTSIGNSAFSICTKLATVTMSKKVQTIGYGAFYRCISLTEIELPSSLTSIAGGTTNASNGTFAGCTALTKVTFANSVSTIGEHAFSGCNALATVIYRGSSYEWANITINATGNDKLLAASLNADTSVAGSVLLICAPTLKAYQTSTPADNKFNIRFAGIVSGLNYRAIGFNISVVEYPDKVFNTVNTSTLYQALYGTTADGTILGELNADDPRIGGGDGCYLTALAIENIPANETLHFIVVPYATLINGERVEGTSYMITIINGIVQISEVKALN